jgi:hypothetical protein
VCRSGMPRAILVATRMARAGVKCLVAGGNSS